MVDPTSAISAIGTTINLFRNALRLAKEVKDALPDDPKKIAIEKSLVQAEKASKIAEAQIAEALGYNICQCEWPPNIMLQIPDSPGEQTRTKCPKCGHIWPPIHGRGEVETVREFDPFDS